MAEKKANEIDVSAKESEKKKKREKGEEMTKIRAWRRN